MSELKYKDSIYVGKEFNKIVKGKDKEGNPTESKSYVYKFKDNLDLEFPMKFWGFDTTKGADKLEEGSTYRIGYVTFPNSHGTESKSARFFSSDTSTPIKESSSEPQRAVGQDTKKTIDYITHLTDYLVDRPNASSNGFAIYVLNKEYGDVVKKARETFDNHVTTPTEELVE
jgi:hypothetical protein